MSLAQLAQYFSTPPAERGRLVNVVSFDLAGTPLEVGGGQRAGNGKGGLWLAFAVHGVAVRTWQGCRRRWVEGGEWGACVLTEKQRC